MTNPINEKIVHVFEVAGADGKCYKCGNHVMSCDCWFKGLKIIDGLTNELKDFIDQENKNE